MTYLTEQSSTIIAAIMAAKGRLSSLDGVAVPVHRTYAVVVVNERVQIVVRFPEETEGRPGHWMLELVPVIVVSGKPVLSNFSFGQFSEFATSREEAIGKHNARDEYPKRTVVRVMSVL